MFRVGELLDWLGLALAFLAVGANVLGAIYFDAGARIMMTTTASGRFWQRVWENSDVQSHWVWFMNRADDVRGEREKKSCDRSQNLGKIK